MTYFRIIDANINRISEGLRVLEDLARFDYNHEKISEDLKILRHQVRKKIHIFSANLIYHRDSDNDSGFIVSQKTTLDNKNNKFELVNGNFKRVQEGLRVVEENLKLLGYYKLSKQYEIFRYQSYNLEKEFIKKLKITSKKNINSDIYCITAENLSNGKSNVEVVKILIDAGIKIIQYREKEKKMLDKYKECLEIKKLTENKDITFIVNDHIDLSIAVGADGVHIGQDDLPLQAVRKLVSENMIIGISTHSPQQAEKAVKDGADYIGVGPIFKTNTKKDVCDPVGYEYLDFVVKNINLPFVAIGGINKKNHIKKIMNHGAKTIAMVSEIVGAKDIKNKINNIRNIISK